MKIRENAKRTEAIQHIIDRMPTNFGIIITAMLLFILTLLFLFSWTIKYHDVIIGEVVINPMDAPVKMVSNTSGKLHLIVEDGKYVEKGQILGYLINSGNVEDIQKLRNCLDTFNLLNDHSHLRLKKQLYQFKPSLGELNEQYFNFINALNSLINHKTDGLVNNEKSNLQQLLKDYGLMLKSTETKQKYNNAFAAMYNKFYSRDSALLSKKVISQQEFDNSQLRYIESLSSKENMTYQLSQLSQEIKTTVTKLAQLQIQDNEKKLQLSMNLSSALSRLQDGFKLWQEKYAYLAVNNGNLQYAKFWVNNEYVQMGEHVFTIISKDNRLNAYINLPNSGAGKVSLGQPVIIKLNNYPYLEYGSVKGVVDKISRVTNTMVSNSNSVENYRVRASLPNKLVTNYGIKLGLQQELRGTAEIVTSDRRLLERVFDNLKYLIQTE